MANTKSAAARHRKSLVRRTRNRIAKSQVRTSIKAFEKSVLENDRNSAESSFKEFVKLIDTAARKKIYHKNTAARKKSRLHKRLLTVGL